MTHRFHCASLPWMAVLGTLMGIPVTPITAQDKVFLIADRPMIDVERVMKMQRGNGAAATNREKLQLHLNSGAFGYPLFFPGGNNFQPWFINDTIVMPADQCRVWEGLGYGSRGSANHRGSILCLRAVQQATRFDGTGSPAKYLTAEGAGNTVTVVGRTVTTRDAFNSVELTGGTNVIPGWYGIVAVDTENNRWTLSANCTSGASSNIQARYCPALVRNLGNGSVARGLTFTAKHLDVDPATGSVAYHIASTSVAGAGGISGDHSFYDCVFEGCDTGILLGRHMGGAYGTTAGWDGSGSDQADHLTLTKVRFANCKSGVHARNIQSVCHSYHHIRASNVDGYVFNFDAGGKLFVDTVEVSGNSFERYDQRNCILRLGPEARRGHSPYVIANFSFDGGNNTRNPQLVVSERPSNSTQGCNVQFLGGIINRAPNENVTGGAAIDRTGSTDNLPLIDLIGRDRVTVRDVGDQNGGSGSFWPGSIRIRTAATGYSPFVKLENCNVTYVTSPQELIRSGSTGGTVKLVDCWRLVGGVPVAVADTTLTP